MAWHMVLPVLVLACSSLARLMRQMRASLLRERQRLYIRLALAKGNPEWLALLRHAWPNAITPLLALIGYSLAYLMSSSLLIEVAMGWPGIGALLHEAILAQDHALILAATLLSALILMTGNLVADILLAMVDPRIRSE
jgi:peptide/nickel transport system permease protein